MSWTNDILAPWKSDYGERLRLVICRPIICACLCRASHSSQIGTLKAEIVATVTLLGLRNFPSGPNGLYMKRRPERSSWSAECSFWDAGSHGMWFPTAVHEKRTSARFHHLGNKWEAGLHLDTGGHVVQEPMDEGPQSQRTGLAVGPILSLWVGELQLVQNGPRLASAA